MSRRVLVTGSDGYIGRETVATLTVGGDICTGYDKKSGQNCLNFVRLLRACEDVDAIVHLAALKSVPDSRKHPFRYFKNNLLSTLSVAMVSRIRGIPVVFSSSAAVYVQDSPYASCKMWEERIVQVLAPRYAILRYFNVGGATEHTNDVDSTNLFSILNKSRHIVINNARSTRDYTHVSDVALANRYATVYLDYMDKSIVTDIFSGEQHSVLSVIGFYRKHGITFTMGYGTAEDYSPFPQVDNRNLLVWGPKKTIEDIVASEIEYTIHTQHEG